MEEEQKKLKLVSNTQIYLDTRRLLDKVLDVTPNIPRNYKFTIGIRMQDTSVSLIQEFAAAYMTRDKNERTKHIDNFRALFETLKTLIRIAGERKWIKGMGTHAEIIELTDKIGKQMTAWKNSLSK